MESEARRGYREKRRQVKNMGIYRFLKNSFIMRNGFNRRVVREYRFVLALFGGIAAAWLYAPGFFTSSNLLLIANQIATVAAVSGCVALVMAAGHFDLSIGAAVAVANMTCALLLYKGCSVPLAVVGPVAAGLLMGMVNGWFVGVKGLASFYVTLATQIGFEGLSYIVGSGGFILRTTALQPLAQSEFLYVPLYVWILLAVAAVLQFLLNNTLYGRYLLAAGYRESTARAAGINVRQIIFINYCIVGVVAGIIGVVYTARVGYGSMTTGSSYAYDGIVGNLLGGNRISGGKASVLRAMAGAYLWGILQNYMGYVGVPYYWQRIIKCVIILFAISRDKKVQEKIRQMWN